MAESLLCSTLHQMFMIARLGPYVFLVGVCWSVTMMIVDNINNGPNELFARHLMCGRCFFFTQCRDQRVVFAEISRETNRRRHDTRRQIGRGRDDCRLLFLRGAHTVPYNAGWATSNPRSIQAPANEERLLAVS